MIGGCARPGCTRRRSESGRYCLPCFAAANQRSHRANRAERNVKRRDRSAVRTALQREMDSARAKLYVTIARGTATKGRCARCGHADVTALILDPAQWREAVWVCRDHRADEIESRKPKPADTWQDDRAAALAAIAALPPDERAALVALARRGPAGMILAEEAPMVKIRLVQLWQKQQSVNLG